MYEDVLSMYFLYIRWYICGIYADLEGHISYVEYSGILVIVLSCGLAVVNAFGS